MRAQIYQGQSAADWRDDGQQCSVTIHGAVFQCDDQDLRDLRDILNFLYQPGATAK